MSGCNHVIDLNGVKFESGAEENKLIDIEQFIKSLESHELATNEHIRFFNQFPVLSTIWRHYQERTGWADEYFFSRIEEGANQIFLQQCYPDNEDVFVFFKHIVCQTLTEYQVELIEDLIRDEEALGSVVRSFKKEITLDVMSICLCLPGIVEEQLNVLLSRSLEERLEFIINWYVVAYNASVYDGARWLFDEYLNKYDGITDRSCHVAVENEGVIKLYLNETVPLELIGGVLLGVIRSLLLEFRVDKLIVETLEDDLEIYKYVGGCLNKIYKDIGELELKPLDNCDIGLVWALEYSVKHLRT